MTSCRPWTFISGTYCILSEICHTDSLFHFAVLDSLADRFLSRELKESAWAKKMLRADLLIVSYYADEGDSKN